MRHQKRINMTEAKKGHRSDAAAVIVGANVAAAPRSSVITSRANRQRILVPGQPAVRMVTKNTTLPVHHSKTRNSRRKRLRNLMHKLRPRPSDVVVQQVRLPGPLIFDRRPSKYNKKVRPLLPVHLINRKNRIQDRKSTRLNSSHVSI